MSLTKNTSLPAPSLRRIPACGITVSLPLSDVDAIDRAAERDGLRRSDIVRVAVKDWLIKNESAK